MGVEQRAAVKISKILSKLDAEAAARVVQSFAEVFAEHAERSAVDDAQRAAPGPSQSVIDARPSFLQTQVRMSVGKDLLEQERATPDRRSDGRRSAQAGG